MYTCAASRPATLLVFLILKVIENAPSEEMIGEVWRSGYSKVEYEAETELAGQ
jgi:hypothetical protein